MADTVDKSVETGHPVLFERPRSTWPMVNSVGADFVRSAMCTDDIDAV